MFPSTFTPEDLLNTYSTGHRRSSRGIFDIVSTSGVNEHPCLTPPIGEPQNRTENINLIRRKGLKSSTTRLGWHGISLNLVFIM